MTHEHLEQIFGTRLVGFNFNGKLYLMGFIKMPSWFNHKIADSNLKELVGNLPLVARIATHEEARDFMESNGHLMPPTWCVPSPENGTVLLYMDHELNVMQAGNNGVAFNPTDKVCICLESKRDLN